MTYKKATISSVLEKFKDKGIDITAFSALVPVNPVIRYPSYIGSTDNTRLVDGVTQSDLDYADVWVDHQNYM